LARYNGLNETLDTQVNDWAKELSSLTPPHGLIDYLRSHGIARNDFIERYRLGYDPGRDALSIPYLTAAGVASVKFRCVAGHDCGSIPGHAKYMQNSGNKSRLYNTRAYFDATETIGLCEGEIDAIAATELVGIPTMGYPGANQWAKYGEFWEVALRDFDRVIVFADGDAPGLECARAVVACIGTRATLVRCADGSDVSGMCVSGRLGELRGRAGL
jgi:hypothetical protein